MKKQENTETRIIKLFGGDIDKTFSLDNLKNLLPKTVRKEKLIHALMVLKRQKRIIERDINVYQLNGPDALVAKPKFNKTNDEEPKTTLRDVLGKNLIGTIDIAQSGTIFVVLEGFDKDPILRGRNLPVLAGDKVEVSIEPSKTGKRPEAKFVQVVERSLSQFIGQFHSQKSKEFDIYFVTPLSQKVPCDFYIASKHIGDAKQGDFVEVEMIEWKEKEKNPRGLVKSVLTNFNPNELEMRSILLDKGFTQDFDESVLAELKAVPTKIPKEEYANRLDLRDVLTLTIDPKTARDFDDALSIQRTEDNNYEVGVHIADVAYYVPANSAVDKEAQKRATSVYLPDRVAPMLPEMLSNDLCSLNPKVDRLAFSVMYTIDTNGKVLSEYVAKTIIHSKRRFTYEEAQAVIETNEGDHHEEIALLWKFASQWRAERFEKGAINFAAPEVQFVLDANQVPVDVVQKIQREANWLIEEFMLRANVSVARALDVYTKASKVPAGIYRNHDAPDLGKLEQFREAALRIGNHTIKKMDTVEHAAKILNTFLKSITDQPESDILNQMAIRSMAKAVYSTVNIGHYGLGYTHYSHFTSPIRRYPDLLAHRLLSNVIQKKKQDYTAAQLEELCLHCSAQEKKATECERDGIRFKQMEYMSMRIGQYFHGVISGMNNTGFWVELKDSRCEGYAELASNFKEGFQFDADKLMLKSLDGKKEFHMGMNVEIKIEKVDLTTKRAWFTLVNY